MDVFLDKAPLVFIAIALVTLVLGFAIVLDLSPSSVARGRRLMARLWPDVSDPDVMLLLFWASLVLAVVLALLFAVTA